MIVIPLFLMMSELGWVNTYQGLILPMAFSSFGTFMLRQFFMTIPKELEEAALIDGARGCASWSASSCRLGPGAGPALALHLHRPVELFPVAADRRQRSPTRHHPAWADAVPGEQGTEWAYLMAGATISMMPGLALTILLQRYIFKGVAIGSGFGGR